MIFNRRFKIFSMKLYFWILNKYSINNSFWETNENIKIRTTIIEISKTNIADDCEERTKKLPGNLLYQIKHFHQFHLVFLQGNKKVWFIYIYILFLAYVDYFKVYSMEIWWVIIFG